LTRDERLIRGSESKELHAKIGQLTMENDFLLRNTRIFHGTLISIIRIRGGLLTSRIFRWRRVFVIRWRSWTGLLGWFFPGGFPTRWTAVFLWMYWKRRFLSRVPLIKPCPLSKQTRPPVSARNNNSSSYSWHHMGTRNRDDRSHDGAPIFTVFYPDVTGVTYNDSFGMEIFK